MASSPSVREPLAPIPSLAAFREIASLPALERFDPRQWGPVPGFEDFFLDFARLSSNTAVIAAGRHGNVLRAQFSGRDIALKLVECGRGQGPEPAGVAEQQDICGVNASMGRAEKEFLREAGTMRLLQHPRIIQLLGVARSVAPGPKSWCIATEFMPGGTLHDAITRREGTPLPLPQALGLAIDIAEALAFVHSKKLVHRDLKSPNILLNETITIAKVADFGTAREGEGAEGEMTGETGTFRWMAPEMVRGENYTHKVDVYSFGIVLWELLTWSVPWGGFSCIQVAFAVAQKDMRPPIPATVPSQLRELIQACWAAKPSRRPDFPEILGKLRLALTSGVTCSDGPSDHAQEEASSLFDSNSLSRPPSGWLRRGEGMPRASTGRLLPSEGSPTSQWATNPSANWLRTSLNAARASIRRRLKSASHEELCAPTSSSCHASPNSSFLERRHRRAATSTSVMKLDLEAE